MGPSFSQEEVDASAEVFLSTKKLSVVISDLSAEPNFRYIRGLKSAKFRNNGNFNGWYLN